MSKEALKLALDALENSQFSKTNAAIKALEEALAKQEQGEPVAWIWRYANGEEEVVFVHPRHIDATHVDAPSTITPLYTTPQQRTWVGLTDEDDIDWEEGGNLKDLVKAIEAKLKEKNT